MKTKRDHQQILYFGRQVFPFKQNLLYAAYLKATENASYGYLRIDLHPASSPLLTLSTHFLDENPVIYLSKEETSDVKYITL
jgi:hypothetical protein